MWTVGTGLLRRVQRMETVHPVLRETRDQQGRVQEVLVEKGFEE